MNKELIEKIIAYNYNEYGAEYGDALVDLKHENEWLHHIIKEVREYIENNTEEKKSWLNGIPDYRVFTGDTKDLLEIIDKVNKENI